MTSYSLGEYDCMIATDEGKRESRSNHSVSLSVLKYSDKVNK